MYRKRPRTEAGYRHRPPMAKLLEMIMSSLRHILLHVDGSAGSHDRLAVAQAIAQPHSAQITALYAATPWLLLYPGAMEGIGPASTVLSDVDVEKLARARQAFQRSSAGMNNVRWDDDELNSPYDFAASALYADLLVLGQRRPPDHADRDVPDDFVPSVLLDSGKPAIIVPVAGSGLQMPLKSVLIAWNASRESARALNALWPLVSEETVIHVAIADESRQANEKTGIQLENFLRQHGLAPRFHVLQKEAGDAGRSLLSLAAELEVSLLTMGCYGHSRAREWVLGGATRTVLRDMTLPVLMAH